MGNSIFLGGVGQLPQTSSAFLHILKHNSHLRSNNNGLELGRYPTNHDQITSPPFPTSIGISRYPGVRLPAFGLPSIAPSPSGASTERIRQLAPPHRR